MDRKLSKKKNKGIGSTCKERMNAKVYPKMMKDVPPKDNMNYIFNDIVTSRDEY